MIRRGRTEEDEMLRTQLKETVVQVLPLVCVTEQIGNCELCDKYGKAGRTGGG